MESVEIALDQHESPRTVKDDVTPLAAKTPTAQIKLLECPVSRVVATELPALSNAVEQRSGADGTLVGRPVE
jgi:hypothetical protein